MLFDLNPGIYFVAKVSVVFSYIRKTETENSHSLKGQTESQKVGVHSREHFGWPCRNCGSNGDRRRRYIPGVEASSCHIMGHTHTHTHNYI